MSQSHFYRNYLQSPQWAEKRRIALSRAGHKCQLCGKPGPRLEVHHNTYARLGNELDTDLCVLCWPCHQAHHERKRGNTQPPQRAMTRKERQFIRRAGIGEQTVMLTATERKRRRNVANKFLSQLRKKGKW